MATIPDDVRRFIASSVSSVPHLEALLLLRRSADRLWDSKELAHRLYVAEPAAQELLAELHRAGLLKIGDGMQAYRYEPNSEELRRIADQLAAAYSSCLVEVTNLIHSKTRKKVQLFADAFKF